LAIANARVSGAVPVMYALIVVTGLLEVAANTVARAAERRAIAWHPAPRTEAPA
jgi:ABC-type nitrate/sulfonate/bicarbonate transport system permease component